jgi:hypothetical protein
MTSSPLPFFVTGRVEQSTCTHPTPVLLRLDCGAGGLQYRRYCRKCWSAMGGAIPHAVAKAEAERTRIEPPLANIDVIRDAQAAYWKRGGR